MSDARTAGDIVNQLGATLEVDSDELPASCLIVASVLHDGERHPRLVIGTSDGMSWVEQAGLLSLAVAITNSDFTRADDEP